MDIRRLETLLTVLDVRTRETLEYTTYDRRRRETEETRTFEWLIKRTLIELFQFFR
jgi:hypothetical protein